MKPIVVLILLLTLTANAFAAAKVCMMEHNTVSAQSQSMPCHDEMKGDDEMMVHDEINGEDVKSDSNDIKSHLCECDKCAQYISPFTIIFANTPLVEPATFNLRNHHSLKLPPRYRPPIYFSA